MQVLTGHTSEATAFLVEDYPYGFKLRCRARFWLEKHPTRGARFVKQTQDPRNGRWNKPNATTYIKVTAVMFLDEKGHVDWAGISEYTSASDALLFVEKYGTTPELQDWACMKSAYAHKFAASDERQAKEEQIWEQIFETKPPIDITL